MESRLYRYHFGLDKSFDRRIRQGAPDPFFARVLDFTLPAVCSDKEIVSLVEWLVDFHDSFRAAFQFDGSGELCARLHHGGPRPPIHIRNVESLRDVEERQQLLSHSHRLIDLLSGPTAIFYYFRPARENRNLLRILCSHFATDQATYRLLAERLASLFRGSAEAKKESYFDWMDAYWSYAVSEECRKETEFWRAFEPAPFARARQLACASKDMVQKAVLTIPREMVGALQAKCRAFWKCRPVDAVIMALVLAIGREFDFATVPLTWTSHGRFPLAGKTFAHTCGWLSSRHPLLVPIKSSRKSELTQALRAALLGLPHWGSSFSWVTRFSQKAAWSGLELELRSPFIVNVQEQNRSYVPLVSASANEVKVCPEMTTTVFLPSHPQYELLLRDELHPMYFAVNLGQPFSITLTSAGEKMVQAANRIMQFASAALCDFALRETDYLSSDTNVGVG